MKIFHPFKQERLNSHAVTAEQARIDRERTVREQGGPRAFGSGIAGPGARSEHRPGYIMGVPAQVLLAALRQRISNPEAWLAQLNSHNEEEASIARSFLQEHLQNIIADTQDRRHLLRSPE